MIDYHLISLYKFFKSTPLKAVRLFLFLILLTVVVLGFIEQNSSKIILFLFNSLIIFEIFYRFRVSKIVPLKKIKDVKNNIEEAATLPVLAATYSIASGYDVVKQLFNLEQVKFLLQRLNISAKEISNTSITKDNLLSYAEKIATKTSGNHITSMDLVLAYLLLNEEGSKLLFNKNLKVEEAISALKWAKQYYPYEEKPNLFRMHSSGSGLGETLMSGWTLETQKYTKDFSNLSLTKNPHILGREKELSEIQATLLKKGNNNVMLVGEMGGGKEALVERLALDSYAGKTEKGLQHLKILQLMIGPLIAGATDRGELEVRLQALIDEVSHARNIILYIPEFQELLGSSSFSMNLTGALYPYLQNGKLPVIATITAEKYKQYLDQSPLKQVFNTIHVDTPSADILEMMLMERAVSIEAENGVIITYKALRSVIDYANRYDPDGTLPGSAITLIEDVVSTVINSGQEYYAKSKTKLVTANDVTSLIEKKTHIVLSSPDNDEKQLLLTLEQRLHERVIGQDRAVQVISEAIRRVRSGMVSQKRPISFLFLGPTGVGKTETAKALAQLYYGGESSMLRLDMSEYSDELGVRRLLGAPPGQGEERGELTDKIHDHPNSLVLLDEFEKANPKIMDLFLQVLEDGRLTDNKGRTVSFVNSLIIATSNAGSEFIRQEIVNNEQNTDFDKRLIDNLQTTKIFKPELLNRFDNVVTFKPLNIEEIGQIAKLLLQDIVKRMTVQDIQISFDESVLPVMIAGGYDVQFGARPLRRYIQDTVEDLVAKSILNNQIKRGDKIVIKVVDNLLQIQKTN